MSEVISIPGLLAALLLPWLCGCIWIKMLLPRSACWNWFVVLGQGYFAGIFVTTIILRIYDTLDIGLGFLQMQAILFLLGVIGLVLLILQEAPEKRALHPAKLILWQKWVAFGLLALLAWRYLNLLLELTTRPLYAWDGWMNWVPKAIVWYHQDELTQFISPKQWLKQDLASNAYTLGNLRAATYPPGVPLVLLWYMLGAQTSDHSLLFLPWLFAVLNLGLALFGHLRLAGIPFLASIIACYVLLSMPYMNVHTVLAGYADLWLAATIALAVFSIRAFEDTRCRGYVVLCLFYLIFCSQLKVPGLIFSLILLAGLLRSLLNRKPETEASIVAVAIGLLTVILTIGITLELTGITRFSLSQERLELPLLGSYSFQFHDVSPAILETLFLSSNWHIFWYAVVTCLIAKLFLRHPSGRVSTESLIICLSLVFLLFVFYFTNHSWAALKFTTLNRTIIYLLPILTFFMTLSLRSIAPPVISKDTVP